MSDWYTEDFSDIVSAPRERHMLIDIMHALGEHGLPDDFCDEGVKPAFNKNSGLVFLVNSEHQACMMNGDRLESWYSTPYEGREGFFEDLVEEYDDMHPEDQEYMRDLAKATDKSIPQEGIE